MVKGFKGAKVRIDQFPPVVEASYAVALGQLVVAWVHWQIVCCFYRAPPHHHLQAFLFEMRIQINFIENIEI